MTGRVIFPTTLDEMTKQRAGEKFRPSNGTEGELFYRAWCYGCQRDKAMREGCDVAECDDNERCEIIADTMCFDVDDPQYPSEWQYGKDGQPCCTAFVPSGSAVPPPRCDKTVDMFEWTAE